MKRSLKRAVSRALPSLVRPRPDDPRPSARERGDAGAQADTPSPPPEPAPAPAEWSVVALARTGEGWRLTIARPTEGSLARASLVLVGRTSGRHLIVPGLLASDGLVVDVVRADLDPLLGETADLWMEPRAGEAALAWRRVTDAREVVASIDASTEADATGWYATAKGNVSLRLGAPSGGPPQAEPRLAEIVPDGRDTRLAVEGVSAAGATLLLVGATSHREVELQMTANGEPLVGSLADEVIPQMGTEVFGLYVSVASGAPGSHVRHPVRADRDVEVVSGSSVRRYWSAGPDGRVTLRRRSPVDVIRDSGVFDADFYRAQLQTVPTGIDLVEHYVTIGAARGLDPSAMFDTRFYRRMNPGLKGDALAHFCEQGWLELRNPSPQFDTWWYWSKHLDLASTDVNPLAHYEAVGKTAGVSTRPAPRPSRRLGAGHRLPERSSVRRICLFAGYDAEGVVDDYVVDYVRELSRYADVHYWADAEMPTSELAKLDGITVTARAERHGEYDFGSYRRLVDAVGWATIESYDELLLVNDSCFLLRPLEDVFATMDARPADWWGLQATKGIAQTREKATRLFREPIPLESVRAKLIDAFEADYVYDFLVGSYFLAYRKPVIADPEFRRYLASVTRQDSKRSIVKKYEIGLTRWLIHHGHTFDTYISKLYPFHPIFTDWYFRLVGEGFPVLKRFFLTENHYHVPNLWTWESRVLERVPDVDLAPFRRNLQRVAGEEQLRRTLGIGERGVEDAPVPDHVLSESEYLEADRLSPKHGSWWAFPVSVASGRMEGDVRAVFERVKDDPSIRKVVLTRGGAVEADGANVAVAPLESPRGQHLLMRCGNVLVDHSITASAGRPISGALRNIIRLGAPQCPQDDGRWRGLESAGEENAEYRAVVSSSKLAALGAAAASYPLTIDQVWATGSPRSDFVVVDESDLPRDLHAELEQLGHVLGGRRLLLVIPAWADGSTPAAALGLDEAETMWLGSWLREHGFVLGVRWPDDAPAGGLERDEPDIPTVDVTKRSFPDLEMLFRASAGLVTDCWAMAVDYLVTGKPIICVDSTGRACTGGAAGRLELDVVAPAGVCRSPAELRRALDALADDETPAGYELLQRLFHDRVDGRASERVVEHIRDLTEVRGVGKPLDERSS